MLMEETPYYYGSAENKLNSKGQVAFPARFRSCLPDIDKNRNYVLVRGHEHCLFMYTHRQFGKIKDNVRRLAEEGGERRFLREFMAKAVSVDLDTQGRFVLPPDLMQESSLQGPNLLFIGMDDRVEIWEPAVYAAARGEGGGYEETLKKAGDKIFGI
jgi:MraZ protein